MRRYHKLIAVDLDGTLLREDKTVAPRDAEAIRAARAAGVAVTLATGRLSTGTLPLARQLGVDVPVVCADGGLVVSPDGTVIDHTPISVDTAAAAMRVLADRSLTPFLFQHDAIHCEEEGHRHRRLVDTWTPDFIVHARLEVGCGLPDRPGPTMVLGVGPQDAIEDARARFVAHHPDVETVQFGYRSGPWAVRLQPAGCSKGRALAAIAARLGLAAGDVAAVGDWLNDVSMFRWAGRSYAMAQAIPEVRAAATVELRAGSAGGEGVAEAIDDWLARI